MPPENVAAWLSFKSAKPLKVGPALYTPPGAGDIVVRNGAVAINPVDWAKQLLGDLLLGHIRYPFILGGDVAGEAVEIGSSVQRFRVGDRVLGLAVAGIPESNNPAEGAFQQYTVLRECLTAAIPDSMSYEQACVLPLTLATAAYSLFHSDFLALDPPTVPPTAASNKVVIITGGASSVGCNAIQLAVSAGYAVYSTSSPRNFSLVEGLGATRVFDYHSPTWATDMIAALQGKTVVGALAIGDGAVEGCTTVLRRSGGTSRKFIAFAGFHLPVERVATALGMVTFAAYIAWWNAKTAIISYVTGVEVKFVDCKDLTKPDGVVSRLVFRDFLPRALAARQLVPAPEPRVVGKGVDSIQEAMDVQMKGVSAQKIVVSL